MRKATLEEIEALDAKAQKSGETTRMRVMQFPRLLEIAREQRGAATADEERTKAAAVRVWGEHVRGCDTVDAMADLIEAQRAEIAVLKSQRCEPGKCPIM